jgi:hypothetical protein
MRRDFGEILADEPDTVPPGGAVRYRFDAGTRWRGALMPSGAPTVGMLAAAGEKPAPRDGVMVS